MLHKNIPYRRHQDLRHKKEAKRRFFDWWGKNPDPVLVGIYATTPHPCSCLGCGNERKYSGVTLDEIRNYLDLKDELEEI